METIKELITRYGLEEDPEHVIIPISSKGGRVKRCYLLKRKFLRVVYPDKHYVDYPLADIIEATVRYPELLLSEALDMIHKDTDAQESETDDGTK